MLIDEYVLEVYADGSSRPHPRRGGVGIRYVWTDDDGNSAQWDYSPPGYQQATNQEMELKACIAALGGLKEPDFPVDPKRFRKIVIFTDSAYVVNNILSARGAWRWNKWTTRDGQPVANVPIWKELVKKADAAPARVYFEWIKGHSKNPHNKAADRLAKQSANMATNKAPTPRTVRRKRSDAPLVPTGVELYGQNLMVYIESSRDSGPPHRAYRYVYEVVTPTSKSLGSRAVAYSKHSLLAGHTYYVRFNADTKNPWILKVHREKKARKTTAPAGTVV